MTSLTRLACPISNHLITHIGFTLKSYLRYISLHHLHYFTFISCIVHHEFILENCHTPSISGKSGSAAFICSTSKWSLSHWAGAEDAASHMCGFNLWQSILYHHVLHLGTLRKMDWQTERYVNVRLFKAIIQIEIIPCIYMYLIFCMQWHVLAGIILHNDLAFKGLHALFPRKDVHLNGASRQKIHENLFRSTRLPSGKLT